jgi:hypothetical protein
MRHKKRDLSRELLAGIRAMRDHAEGKVELRTTRVSPSPTTLEDTGGERTTRALAIAARDRHSPEVTAGRSRAIAGASWCCSVRLLMVERGVPVVFRPENPQRARIAGPLDHSHVATSERTSHPGGRDRTGNGTRRPKADLPMHLRKGMPDELRLKRAVTLFALLADRQRHKILLALKAGNDLCVGEVARILGVSVSVASHHLRKLRDLEILETAATGS